MKKISICRILSVVLCVAMLACMLVGCSGKEEKYPSGDITLNIAAKPGGDTDAYGRILAQYMTEELGVNVAVSNNGDGGGFIACRDVHNAEPDGYNAVFYHASYILGEITGSTDLSLTEDYTIISTPVRDTTSCIVVSAKKFADREDFYARAKAGEEIIAGITPGTYAQLSCVQLDEAIGANVKYVTVDSAADRITDLLAGRIDMFFTQYGTIAQYVDSGDFLCLGIMAEERNAFFDDEPTFIEQGIDITLEKVFFMAFPPETDKAIVDAVAAALEKAEANQECIDAFAQYYVVPKYMSPEDSLTLLKGLNDTYRQFEDVLKG